MKSFPADKVFVPAKLPAVESVGLRADRGALRLWMIDAGAVVVAELVLSPEDGWELAKDIVAIADRAAGIVGS